MTGGLLVIGACVKQALGIESSSCGVRIGANALVLQDLPDDATAVGVPARVIRIRECKVCLLEDENELSDLLRGMVERMDQMQRRLEEIEGERISSEGKDE